MNVLERARFLTESTVSWSNEEFTITSVTVKDKVSANWLMELSYKDGTYKLKLNPEQPIGAFRRWINDKLLIMYPNPPARERAQLLAAIEQAMVAPSFTYVSPDSIGPDESVPLWAECLFEINRRG